MQSATYNTAIDTLPSFEEVMPFYLGCRVRTEVGDGQLIACSIIADGDEFRDVRVLLSTGKVVKGDAAGYVMPILRRLEAATDADWDAFPPLQPEGTRGRHEAQAVRINHLCKAGFDCFGLIRRGQAVDAQPVQQQGAMSSDDASLFNKTEWAAPEYEKPADDAKKDGPKNPSPTPSPVSDEAAPF
jgi:hypothetical protein